MKINRKSYANYSCLFVFIMVLFIVLNLFHSDKLYIDLFGENIKVNKTIAIEQQDEYYLSYDFVENKIDRDIYFDTVSRKVVISTDDCLLKIRVGENKISKNFHEQEISNVGVVTNNEKMYISLEVLEIAYGFRAEVRNNTIYIFKDNSFDITLKSNDVKMYVRANNKSKVVDYVNKKNKVIGFFENKEYVFVMINKKEVGYISKSMAKYQIPKRETKAYDETKKNYIFADNTEQYLDKGLLLDGVLINIFDVTKQSGEVNVRSINKNFISDLLNKGYKAYGIVTNGYSLATFSTTTTSQILADESKRLILINNLAQKLEEYNLNGIVIDFRMIKETDIDSYVQFIKELNAFCKKDVVVSIDANEYKRYIKAINYSNFSVLNLYGLRNSNSTVAGSIAEISWMKQVIDDTLEIARPEKIIAGIPAYSILWTEKNSVVVDTEIYNLNAIREYILKNDLEKKYVEQSKQNYIELTKGTLTYKMWVEDDISIKNRLQIIRDNKLKGIAIYKLGYENNQIFNIIKNK